MNKKQQLTELINREVKKIITEVRNKKTKKVKKTKKPTIEGITVESHKGVEKNDLGSFFVVLNPAKGFSNENIMFETDLFNFTERVQSGKLAFENVRAIFKKQESANRLKERIIKERNNSIMDAKNQAEKLKGLRDEVASKAQTLKQTKLETIKAVKNIK